MLKTEEKHRSQVKTCFDWQRSNITRDLTAEESRELTSDKGKTVICSSLMFTMYMFLTNILVIHTEDSAHNHNALAHFFYTCKTFIWV